MQMRLRRWHAVYAGRRVCDLNCCQCRLCLTGVHSAVWKPFSLEHALKNIATISFWQVEQSVGSTNWPARSHSAGFQHANVNTMLMHTKHKGGLNYDGTFLNVWVLESCQLVTSMCMCLDFGGSWSTWREPTWKLHPERPELESNHQPSYFHLTMPPHNTSNPPHRTIFLDKKIIIIIWNSHNVADIL